MNSSNFDFLEHDQPKLYEYGRSAESYVFSDPQTAIIKLRCFAEQFVAYIYQELQLPSYGAKDFFQKLDNAAFVDTVEKSVVDILHLIRIKGNKAAHKGIGSSDDARALVKDAYFLGAWIFVSFNGGSLEELPKYSEPSEDDSANNDDVETETSQKLEEAQNELKVLQQQLDLAQKQLESLSETTPSTFASTELGTTKALTSTGFEIDDSRSDIRLEDCFAEFELTRDQANLVADLDSFLSSADRSVFLLRGYAGTGKTFITKGLTEYFRAIRRNYVLAAPTGKAAKVIESKTQSPAHTIHKTIYSFKDIAEYRDDDLEGSETYKYYAKLAVNELSVDTVYIVDEASMVSDIYNEAEFFRFGSGHLLRDFLKFVNLDHNDHRKKLILIGDNAQLPPVGMSFSPALNPKYLAEEYGLSTLQYELREVVRQKTGSGIMKNANMIRNSIDQATYNQLDLDVDATDVSHVDYANVLPEYLKSCDSKINADSIVIAYSNADVAAYNRLIRGHFFPEKTEVAPGDKVMAVSNSNAYGVFISNGDFGLVRQILSEREQRSVVLKRKSQETGKVEEIKIDLSFRDVEIGFKDLDGSSIWFKAKVIENLLYSDEPNLSSDENKALYLDFCIRHSHLKRRSLEFKEELQRDPYFNALKLKFGYAITCHKAQGSEWNNVFVKCKTHQNQLSASYFRWLYTAITRASNNLYLLEEPHIKNRPKLPRDPGTEWSEPSTGREISSSNSTSLSHEDGLGNETKTHEDEKFSFSNEFLQNVLTAVRRCLTNTDISIIDIEHQQYQESYLFDRGSEVARINIAYNGSSKIVSVVLPSHSNFGEELLSTLSRLEGTFPRQNAQKTDLAEIVFHDEFLNQLHAQLIQSVSRSGISITGVEEQQWSQRYTFTDETGTSVVDIYYNKKKQFGTCNPVKSLSSSRTLTERVLRLLTEELQ